MFRADGSVVVNGERAFDASSLLSLSRTHLQELGFELIRARHHGGLALLGDDLADYWSFVALLSRESKALDSWIKENNPVPTYLLLFESVVRGPADLPNWRGLLLTRHARPLSSAVAAAFAYLEGLCRRSCSTHVDAAGNVLRQFSVPRPTANSKLYSVGSRVNNLGDVLWLTAELSAPDTRTVLNSIFAEVAREKFFDWRNGSLHGSTEEWAATNAVFCTLSVLVLEHLDVDDARANLLRGVQIDRIARGDIL